MRVQGKVVRLELLGGLGVGRVVQQDGAQNGLFGVYVRRQSGIEGQVGDGGHIVAVSVN